MNINNFPLSLEAMALSPSGDVRGQQNQTKGPRPAPIPPQSTATLSGQTGQGILQEVLPLSFLASGPGFNAFTSPFGICGTARESTTAKPNKKRRGQPAKPTTIELLVIQGSNDDKNSLSNFLMACKRYYRQVCIWEVFNPWLADLLKRRNFTATHRAFIHGYERTCYAWNRPERKKHHANH